MKKLSILFVVAILVPVGGCAKKSDVAALRSEIASLKANLSKEVEYRGQMEAAAIADQSILRDELENVRKLVAKEEDQIDRINFAWLVRAQMTPIGDLEKRIDKLEFDHDMLPDKLESKADALQLIQLEERVEVAPDSLKERIEAIENDLPSRVSKNETSIALLEEQLSDIEHDVFKLRYGLSGK
jgi:hypothetical protein